MESADPAESDSTKFRIRFQVGQIQLVLGGPLEAAKRVYIVKCI